MIFFKRKRKNISYSYTRKENKVANYILQLNIFSIESWYIDKWTVYSHHVTKIVLEFLFNMVTFSSLYTPDNFSISLSNGIATLDA